MTAYVGEIRLFGGNFAPVGWALCNGQLLAIAQNETLFQLIGTTYGGDGVTTFALPDLRGRVPVHTGGPNTYILGEQFGVESVTLTTNQLPVHSHAPTAATTAATSPSPAGAVPAKVSAGARYAGGTPSAVAMHPQPLSPTGGFQPHENMAPSTTITFIIALEGVYPSPT
ncbi:MAG TPA: tail fiber protein [Ilumatobacteraceae bacterium]